MATLNSAIEDVLEPMSNVGINGLDEQTEFLAQCLKAWLVASGRLHDVTESEKLDPDNVAYQVRVLVSAVTLLPACLLTLKKRVKVLISDRAEQIFTEWFSGLMKSAGLLRGDKFLAKGEFKEERIPDEQVADRTVDAKSASYFATGAVEIWLRGVHSF